MLALAAFRVGVAGALLVSLGWTNPSALVAAPLPVEIRPGCVACHGSPEIQSFVPGRRGARLYVPPEALSGSAHESIGCGCHPPLSPYIHADVEAQRRAARTACAGCHSVEAERYIRGAHVPGAAATGLGGQPRAATVGARCVLCHGSHQIVRAAEFPPAPDRKDAPAFPVGLAFGAAGAAAAVGVGWMVGRRGRRSARTKASRADPADPGRRRFLRFLGVAAGAAALDTVLPAKTAEARERLEELAREHENDVGVLVDVSRCIGCGSCVAACKLSNGLEWREDQPWLGAEAELASSNWCMVRTVEVQDPAGPTTHYLKRQCMHCLEPACVSACPVAAMRKESLGPVTYDVDRCIGCRYCLMACPFEVPTFAWDRRIAEVSKCNLCFERVARGGAPACASACPAGALAFGPRWRLLEVARERIDRDPDRYQPEIYGETEAGGTSVLYISDVPFSELGLPQGVPERPLPDYTWELSRLVPPFAAGLGALLVALYARRRRLVLEEGGQGSSPEPGAAAPAGEGRAGSAETEGSAP